VLPGVSDDLGELCDRLLKRDPFSRPSDEEILAWLEPVISPQSHATLPRPRVSVPFKAFDSLIDALREMLGRLGIRRNLAVFIDDLQWSDADSLALLGDLLRPPDPPLMLLVDGEMASPSRRLAEAIARESGGNPCFLDVLIRYCRMVRGEPRQDLAAAPRLETALRACVERLPATARRLVELVSAAGTRGSLLCGGYS